MNAFLKRMVSKVVSIQLSAISQKRKYRKESGHRR